MERDLIRRSITACLLTLAVSTNVHSQVQDTIFKHSPLLVGKDALLLGAFTLGTAAVAPIDRYVAARLQDPRAQQNRVLRRAATGFRLLADPGSFATGTVLYAIGRADGQRRLQALGLHSVESILIADLLGGTIKFVAGRQRPYVDVNNPYNFQLGRGLSGGDQYRSFPSGHTITAFAFASTVSRETQFWWPHQAWIVGTVFYGGAGLVGLSRMYNNMHWASDVMAGAAIGTLVGLKVVKYTHSHPGNQLDNKLIKGKKKNMLVPTPILFTLHF
jgi:membrane-associated phospholipid phosphatase